MNKKEQCKMKKIFIIILILIILLGVGAFFTYKSLIGPVSDSKEEKEIIIPLGSSADEIAKILEENNLIKGKLIFKVYVKLHKVSDFQAGTYYLKESMDLKEITDMLQTGIMFDPNEMYITYIEGKNVKWLANMIETRTNNSADSVYELLKDEEYLDKLIEKYWFITEEIKNEDIYYALEGYLFPDTYAIANKDITVEEIFEKMLDRMDEVLNEYKDEIESGNHSVHEILTLASVIELESVNTEDRKDVASVFYNRLNEGMSLGSDVTTYYAIGVDVGERDLYKKEIDEYNPYNTRGPNMEGKLPVGPISSVSKSSLEAAIEPNNTTYLFFVADKNKKVYFTNTNAEHEQIIQDLVNKGLWYEY